MRQVVVAAWRCDRPFRLGVWETGAAHIRLRQHRSHHRSHHRADAPAGYFAILDTSARARALHHHHRLFRPHRCHRRAPFLSAALPAVSLTSQPSPYCRSSPTQLLVHAAPPSLTHPPSTRLPSVAPVSPLWDTPFRRLSLSHPSALSPPRSSLLEPRPAFRLATQRLHRLPPPPGRCKSLQVAASRCNYTRRDILHSYRPISPCLPAVSTTAD
ncbi:hypothetical protein BU25DRAFT_152809 [Macroventuria anomochaeta]|uniref:Uncharacterized protein n=1 Tax=Macroventuria anomochaeta TaxID=301207 RepID=A0ACB6SGU6_9PLEO|nr:uncharacterized protein BU25DRAFT_152809 [Macroventuria anomochaeta]KAF2632484.1 hypothetical protein BU25DRAFT_152809 [Macroventuria anomochaeta]